MKILYLDCSMGAAGDMLNAALYELLDDEKKRLYLDAMESLSPAGVSVRPEKSVKCGVTGTHMRVLIEGHEEHEHEHEHEHHHEHDHEHEHEHGHEHHHEHEHGHEHEHHHEHGHHHEHVGMDGIRARVEGLNVSDAVKRHATEVYRLIADAESEAHGVPVEEIHFHEVGSLDAAADVVGCCLLMELISPDRTVVSPVCTGFGHVHCAHGILPVPAPATLNIMRGAPCYAGNFKTELLTPTGAALLRHFADEFAEMPLMTPEKTGYGMGRKDLEQANCVRAVLGFSEGCGQETVFELACSVDDMTGERVGFAVESLFEAGALDAWWESIGMKKGRPGVKICALCRDEAREDVRRAMFRMTSTLGVRETEMRRCVLDRRTHELETALGRIRVKEAEGYGTVKRKYEYEDVARIARARGLAPDEVAEMADKGLI